MALIKCPGCGKAISDKADNCPNCGYPVKEDSEYSNLYTSSNAFTKKQNRINSGKTNETGYSSTGRMIVGIIFIVLSAAVLFQSCAAGMVNALGGGSGSDGLIGTFTALIMIIVGIISITTRKTDNPKIPLILGIITIVYGFLIGYMYDGIFKDLKFYGWLMIICSLVHFTGFKKLKNK